MAERLIANSVQSLDKMFEGTPCWEWTGQLNSAGYGYMSVRKDKDHPSKVLAHRMSYETFKGPIAFGLVVMHRCNNKPCISPLHIVAGTSSQNTEQATRDGLHPNARHRHADDEPAPDWHEEW